MSFSDLGHSIHLPWGYIRIGARVRGVCSCGHTTTRRANRARALDALLAEHGYTKPVCVLCGRDFQEYPAAWDQLRDRAEILPDGAAGTFLVCRGMPRSCQDAYAQRQLRLDRTVADGFDIELPRPRLRVIASAGVRR